MAQARLVSCRWSASSASLRFRDVPDEQAQEQAVQRQHQVEDRKSYRSNRDSPNTATSDNTLVDKVVEVLSAVASMGAMLSLLEVPVAWLSETFRISRPRATVLMTLALILLGAPATLSTSVLSDVTVFGLSLFDLYDFLSSNLMLPLDGLLLSLFVGYVWSRSDALDALTNGGTLHNLACAKAILFLCRYVTPILIVIILLNGLKVF